MGYGLRIPHITGGGIIGPDKMGKHCIVNAGVVIGTKTGTIKRPILGDNCEITIGGSCYRKHHNWKQCDNCA